MQEKNKKNVNVMLIVIVILSLTAIIGFVMLKFIKKEEIKDVPAGTVTNLKESFEAIPDFTIQIDGLYFGSLTDEFLRQEKVKLYEFDAGIDISFGTITSHYVGVKLQDVLDALQITNFDQIEFVASGRLSTTYLLEELKDDMFLVFYRDGELVSENNSLSFLAVNYPYRYSLDELSEVFFANSEVQHPENSTESATTE